MDWGMKSRMSRLIKPDTGKAFWLAIDHGYFLGPTRSLEKPGQAVDDLYPMVDALFLTRGVLRSAIPAEKMPNVILRASGGPSVVGATLGGKAALVADDRLQMAGLIALIFLAASGMLRNADDTKSTQMRHRIRVGADGQPLPVGPTATETGAQAAPAGGPAADDGFDQDPLDQDPQAAPRHRWLRIILSATGVGLITGFFGVGGGFIAVPALIWGVGLPVKKATATGLVVIIINSATALAARGPGLVDWGVTAELSGFAVLGAVFGALLSHRLSDRLIKRLFGFLLLVVGFHEVLQLALQY